MEKNKFIGIIGSGEIGRDPFDPKSFSGSSRFFFSTCDKYGILDSAFGVEVPRLPRYSLILKNFSFNRTRWRRKFYLDTDYYDFLTRELKKKLALTDPATDTMQIGGIYDVPGCMERKGRHFLYDDGNLAQLLRSPYMPKGISAVKIDKALKYERNVYHQMDQIFAMSEYLRLSFIEDFGVPEHKVKKIGAGINLEKIPEPAEKDYNEKRILFIGVDFERKGGAILLRAFRAVKGRYPEAELNIVGPRELRISNELAKGVRFHGFLSKQNPQQSKTLEDLFKRSCLFVMPSLYEPFGIAPLEAMANGIPCVLTNAWAFPDMVRPGYNGDLIECGNSEELAEKMIGFLDSPDTLKRMGEAGRRIVMENYTWDVVVEKLIAEID